LLRLCRISEAECAGNCNDENAVTIDELLRGANIALGNTSIADTRDSEKGRANSESPAFRYACFGKGPPGRLPCPTEMRP
jgi:hypothetical protein